jgi:hypothetical protein
VTFLKRRIVWVPLAIVLAAVILLSFFRGSDNPPVLTFGDVLAYARAGQLERVDATGARLTIKLRGDEKEYRSYIGSGTDLTRALEDAGATVGGSDPKAVRVRFEPGRSPPLLWPVYVIVILGAIIYFAVRLATRPTRSQP